MINMENLLTYALLRSNAQIRVDALTGPRKANIILWIVFGSAGYYYLLVLRRRMH